MELEDIDLTAATLRVRSGKGKQDRTLEIDRKTLTALKQWEKARPAASHDSLFTSDRNLNYRPLSIRGLRWLVGKYLGEAGITKQASCHTLRHTCAAVRYAKGASLLMVSKLLGHRSLATTQLYLHPERQDTKQVMEATNP